MNTYPTIIVDDFFENPDDVVELANSVDYPFSDHTYPGKRSAHLGEIDGRFYNYFVTQMLSAFGLQPRNSILNAYFQKVKPFSDEKWDKKNCGWIHRDSHPTIFGGIVYLNKNADKDTGTSIYRLVKGFGVRNPEEQNVASELRRGNNVNDIEYTERYTDYHNQFEETVKVDNVYNRFFSFPNTAWHGVRTYGIEERLTIAFFCSQIDPENLNPTT